MNSLLTSKNRVSRLSLYCFLLCLLSLGIIGKPAQAAEQRPFRGSIGMSVLLCKYKNEPTPAHLRSYYEDMVINAGKGGLADYWNEVSFGSIDLKGSVVKGWYTLDQTAAEADAYGGGGSPLRIKKWSDCRDKAIAQGYTPPSDHVVVVVTSPQIDIFGADGRVFVGENVDLKTLSHESGHGLTLQHAYSDDPNYQNASWADIGQYDDQWDVMGDCGYGKNTAAFNKACPGPNGYHRDRLGWLKRGKIFRFGADGQSDRTITLTAINKPDNNGYQMVRIPFDVNDRYHYFTVEYRVQEGWDSAIPGDIILIHEIKKNGNGNLRSFLLRNHTGARKPVQKLDRDGIKILLVSQNPANHTAKVRIQSNRVDRCLQGYVWREAGENDKVCVSPARRNQVHQENLQASSRRKPGGGKYGPDTCKQGYVWREAFNGDHVCVSTSSRSTAREENLQANERRLASAAYGPNTCKQGYVWREADQSDWVCVTAERRSEVKEENNLASTRQNPSSGSSGNISCKQGYVWREAFTGDQTCVPPASRTKARQENESASDRLANIGA